MKKEFFDLFCYLSIMCIVFWTVPYKYKNIFLSVVSVMFMLYVSIYTMFILFLTSIFSFQALNSYTRNKKDNMLIVWIYGFMILFIGVKLIIDNGYINLTVIGFSYFMCRQIHCLIDVYSGKIGKLSFSDYIAYQLFLPTIYTGPINRYQIFERQFKRLKFDSKKLSISIERIVYGCFKFIFVANYIVVLKLLPLISINTTSTSILNLYGLSIVFWSYLYFAFSGLSDVAIGFSGCFGITIEENFNYPYKAKNIMDFWQRWHITLTSWVKDYVFMPVFSKFRSRTIAIVLALIAIGLWHQISIYYLVWGVYQALGIVIFQIYVSRFSDINKKIPFYIRNVFSRLYVFVWILSTIPVLFTMGLTHEVL
ncbi:hypothetical protein IB644_00480 [Allofrancisella guangzhouensis]|uniref:MBOAT family O-acyltransferase n=1 Tax=Allofrancisella guangzhouensis TaxID=594679 RepID=UPI001907B49A|nr:MBOAT family O-acyltransferase [Allofrancisella guangzhouensis]MBK2045036.1 hypothetical protein [Allofrancisella guangzhouensis]